ncbi:MULTISPECIES: nodulation protein NolB [Bradyrhizobium]|uniref:Nodulation protein NolB n=2 Tax=Bradyrhizobium TaxID=374 RepID=A0A9X1RKP0_9BRAD|nr:MULTISPECIES: nodulation protein NolB [Bradyrhizobium]MCG2632873.1 nodulation protein NolB [Bradyrhizobium zhengyangense]MCG2645486.1 nodulation protein NolB [Bradyrhizobium zhengyangense]MCG2673045.1 nodulation protein NolB [Bradyrhizobium zhengyangense]MDN4984428.1 nodulation protein NolB [Bradyrhizobium sp. WYCCWR 13022]MDN5002421.1 nodulation protein NolB [Bradyrhizobium sp. WYCCWR 12677]
MIPSVMFGAMPISANLGECLTEGCSSAPGNFHEHLAKAASKQGAASLVADSALAPPVPEVQRAVAQTGPLGDRILQNLFGAHLGKPYPSTGLPSIGEPGPSKSVQLGPAARPISRLDGVDVHVIGKPEGADNFESTLQNLRDVYNGVIQVSLISKSAGAVGSSLNKLLSAG